MEEYGKKDPNKDEKYMSYGIWDDMFKIRKIIEGTI